jgi:hypothetical protein
MANEKYPWLCNTIRDDYECTSPNVKNIVSEDEAYEAQAYTTEAYGKFGLKFTYYKISHQFENDGEWSGDKLYGEDTLQYVERAFYFKGYTDKIPPNVLNYQLQGIWGADILEIFVGRAAFQYWSTYGGKTRNDPEQHDAFEPRIGDVVYLEPNKTFYEIADVKYYNTAFGLQSQTYDLTMRVYKDCKFSIPTDGYKGIELDPTLSDPTDPIYDVATNGFHKEHNTNDPLKLNDKFRDIEKSENAALMDPLYRKKSDKVSFDPFEGWK